MSKHEWNRDGRGDIIPADEDSEHPVAVCRTCGNFSGCLHAQENNYECYMGVEPRLDAEDCEGVDLRLTVEITIRHPGPAREFADRTAISKRVEIPMSSYLDGHLDIVSEALAEAVKMTAVEWRARSDQYREDWQAASTTGGGP